MIVFLKSPEGFITNVPPTGGRTRLNIYIVFSLFNPIHDKYTQMGLRRCMRKTVTFRQRLATQYKRFQGIYPMC